MRDGFGGGDGEKHGVGVVDVEHETGKEGEEDPLTGRSAEAGGMPVVKKKRDNEGGVRVRPGRIEVHVDRERAGPPDGDRREKGATLSDISAREAIRKKKAEEAI